MEFPYRLKSEVERVGAIELKITRLADLNQTIDELFLELEKTGREELLEDLCPYFGTIWPSARALSSFMAQIPELKNLRILEVGCGLALPSLLCAKRGAQVVATDFHPDVPFFLELNAKENQISGLEYIKVNWQLEFPGLGKFDWIIGSDVLYESKHSLILADAVSHYLNSNGKIVITDPARPYLQSFVDAMKAKGFDCISSVVTAPDHPKPKEIFVTEFSRVSREIS